MSTFNSVSALLALTLAFGALLPGYRTSTAQRLPWLVDRAVAEPIVFGEGVVSTTDDDMDASFTADGKTLYFTRAHFPNRLGVILETHFANGGWSAPEVVSFSGRFTDYDPFVTADGSKIYFASNRSVSGSTPKDFDIWFVEKTASGWSHAHNAGDAINTAQDEFYPTIAADGTLYFSATRADTRGRSDIYLSRWRDGQWQAPENLGAGVNSAAQEVDSYVSPDQSFVVFAGFGRPDDMGNGDLYISERVDGVFGPARHLGNGINTSAREYCPGASPDGKYFFFTSFRGFADSVPATPWNFRELQTALHSIRNGWGNVFQIDMSALR
jgi:Tol biopolymer transport system component